MSFRRCNGMRWPDILRTSVCVRSIGHSHHLQRTRDDTRVGVCRRNASASVFIGMSYPACMGLATDWLGRNGEDVSGLGQASGLKTRSVTLWVCLSRVSGFAGIRLTRHPALLHLGRFVDRSVDGGCFVRECSVGGPFFSTGLGPGPCFCMHRWSSAVFPLGWDLDKMSQGSNVISIPRNGAV